MIVLASVAQLVGASSGNQKVAGSIPDLVRTFPVRACMEGNQLMFFSHINVSLSLSLSKTMKKMSLGEDKKIILIKN